MEVVMEKSIIQFKPANHTASVQFMTEWCGNCQHGQNQPCDIAVRTMWLPVSDPNYPKEWVVQDGKPVCTSLELLPKGCGWGATAGQVVMSQQVEKCAA